jgi:hypothetical protein
VLNYSPGLSQSEVVRGGSADPGLEARRSNTGVPWITDPPKELEYATGDYAIITRTFAPPVSTEGIPSTINMSADAAWTVKVLSPSATGQAVADADMHSGLFRVNWRWPKTMDEKMRTETNTPDSFFGWLPGPQVMRPAEGQTYRIKISTDGIAVPMRSKQGFVIARPDAGAYLVGGVLPFPFAHYFGQLPEEPVGVGDTWRGTTGIITGITDTTVRVTPVTFRLEGFEYRGAHRCARITTSINGLASRFRGICRS